MTTYPEIRVWLIVLNLLRVVLIVVAIEEEETQTNIHRYFVGEGEEPSRVSYYGFFLSI